MNDFSNELEKLAIKNGILFRKCNEHHIQIKAIHTVNVYESTQSYYVSGANKKAFFNAKNPMMLINIAMGNTDQVISSIKSKRKCLSKSKKELIKSKIDTCYVCGEIINSNDQKTIEHKIPLCKGGSKRIDNLSISHYECNQKRKNKLSKE